MQDRFEAAFGLGIGEYQRAHPVAIEAAVRRRDVGTEAGDERRHRRAAGSGEAARITSVSTMAAPRACNRSDTAVLPEPIPPVMMTT